MDRRFVDRFTATRARLVDESRERHPFDRSFEEMAVVARADVDRLSRATGWATRTGPGSYSFDWRAAQRALDRPLSPFEQRILRESIWEAEDEEESSVEDLVDSLDAFLGD